MFLWRGWYQRNQLPSNTHESCTRSPHKVHPTKPVLRSFPGTEAASSTHALSPGVHLFWSATPCVSHIYFILPAHLVRPFPAPGWNSLSSRLSTATERNLRLSAECAFELNLERRYQMSFSRNPSTRALISRRKRGSHVLRPLDVKYSPSNCLEKLYTLPNF